MHSIFNKTRKTLLPQDRAPSTALRGRILLGSLSLGLLWFFVSLYLTRGDTARYFLFPSEDQYFSDFFDCLYWLRDARPQDTVLVYPASANIWLYAFSHCLPLGLLDETGPIIRDTQLGMFVFSLYSILTIAPLSILLYSKKKGPVVEKLLFCAVILLSRPMLFCLDRGNIIALALLFLLAFLAGKDSENKVVRELSFLCLAFSAGIKLYPALFGMLLVKERRWKEAARLVVYGLLVFFLPGFVFYGRDAFAMTLGVISKASNWFAQDASVNVFQLSLRFAIRNLCGGGGLLPDLPWITWVVWGISALGAGAFFLTNSRWKTLFLLTCLCVVTPDFSLYYSLLLFTAPLLAYLNSDDPWRWTDGIYLLGFFFLFTPFIPCGALDYPFVRVQLPSLLFLIMAAEEWFRRILRVASKRRNVSCRIPL